MAKLQVLHFPDPRLRNRAEPVDAVNDSVRQFIDDMFETMYDAPGIGLAATQVNDQRRIITIDVSEDRDEPLALINPRVVATEGEIQHEEGCLSVPDVFEFVSRARWIRAEALDRNGEPFEFEAEDLLAVCVQHEIDHLDGKLFVDYLSSLKRNRIRKRAVRQRDAA